MYYVQTHIQLFGERWAHAKSFHDIYFDFLVCDNYSQIKINLEVGI